jgi:hypothetical protein
MGIGFSLIVINIGYLIFVTGPANVLSIFQLTIGLFGFVLILVSMALTEMNAGKKNAKEAAITIAFEMLMLGLFILLSTLFRK